MDWVWALPFLLEHGECLTGVCVEVVWVVVVGRGLDQGLEGLGGVIYV